MKSLEHELRVLDEERQRIEAERVKANETLRQAQQALGNSDGHRNQLAAQIAPMQRLLTDVTKGQTAVAAQRQAAQGEIEAAEKAHDELLAQINKDLPEARRSALQAAIEAVDKPIDDLKRDVQTLQDKKAETEAALTNAQKRAAALEAGIRESLAQLRQLPQQIQAARTQVAQLTTQAKAAAVSGRSGEAFYLASELNQALKRLSELADSDQESKLVDRLDELWQESQAAKAAVAEKSAALEQFGRELTAAESELQRQSQTRAANIKAALVVKDAQVLTKSNQPTELVINISQITARRS